MQPCPKLKNSLLEQTQQSGLLGVAELFQKIDQRSALLDRRRQQLPSFPGEGLGVLRCYRPPLIECDQACTIDLQIDPPLELPRSGETALPLHHEVQRQNTASQAGLHWLQ